MASAALVLSASPALAGGMFVSERGVRPLGRGGAFVAGADDAGAVTYNPAGLAFAPDSALVDLAWVNYGSTYQRHTLVRQRDPNTGAVVGEYEQVFPSVEGESPFLPIPTLVLADSLGVKDFRFAAALWAPYAGVMSYPETVAGQPAPQRYSLLTMEGSALAIAGLYGAWSASPKVALGAGFEVLGGTFQTEVAFSACVPDRFICAPEQPDYDAYSRLTVGPIVAPTGVVGITAVPAEVVRLGASFHLPIRVDAPGTIDVRLPSAAPFDGASQRGDEGNVVFDLPWTLRTGVEVRPAARTRAELAFTYEAWSQHEDIRLDPDGVALTNVQAFPPEYYVAPISLPRHFQDSWSVRLGGEQGFDAGKLGLTARAGVAWEASAVPPEWLTVTTIDTDKLTLSLGGGVDLDQLRLDVVVAQVIGMEVKVDARQARMTQVNPVLANPPADPHTINGGTYQHGATIIGLGASYRFDGTPEGETTESAGPAE